MGLGRLGRKGKTAQGGCRIRQVKCGKCGLQALREDSSLTLWLLTGAGQRWKAGAGRGLVG